MVHCSRRAAAVSIGAANGSRDAASGGAATHFRHCWIRRSHSWNGLSFECSPIFLTGLIWIWNNIFVITLFNEQTYWRYTVRKKLEVQEQPPVRIWGNPWSAPLGGGGVYLLGHWIFSLNFSWQQVKYVPQVKDVPLFIPTRNTTYVLQKTFIQMGIKLIEVRTKAN